MLVAAQTTPWSNRDFANAKIAPAGEVERAKEVLDLHVQEMMVYHFSEETGCPYWLGKRSTFRFDPIKDVKSYDDLVRLFPIMEPDAADNPLKQNSIEPLIPNALKDKPYSIYLTGGTSGGAPCRRPTWDDYKIDYGDFSADHLDQHFPEGGKWLFAGPSGPRRLPDAIRYMAQLRGGVMQGIDFDPVFVKKMQNAGDDKAAQAYISHIVAQVIRNLDTKEFSSLFIPPPILEAVLLQRNLWDSGIRGVFSGGTEINPGFTRQVMAQLGKVAFCPTYGNTLMGLAKNDPVTAENDYAVIYGAPQPRAVLRLVDPDNRDNVVPYDHWGRIELTTMTKEFFLPRYSERDEAIRRRPAPGRPFDGVEYVRPLGSGAGVKTKVGAY